MKYNVHTLMILVFYMVKALATNVADWRTLQIDEDLAKINIDDPKYQMKAHNGGIVSGVIWICGCT